MDIYEKALLAHKKWRGKIETKGKAPAQTADELSIAYTPGVAQPCLEIEKNQEAVYEYTGKGNSVAVITDGTAVLGLGNIGPLAALPVMEGKALLFKEFAGIDAFPILLDTTDTQEIIATVKRIAPSFGGINLEDISAPRCVEIEQTLMNELSIPVFHDDQHGTAIVVLAALINALKVVGKEKESIRVVVSGAGAAGSAIIKMLLKYGVKDILAFDKEGIITRDSPANTDLLRQEIAELTNISSFKGTLKEGVTGADVFIGVSAPNLLSKKMVQSMNPQAIVFAMANPEPEISYDAALEAGVAVVGTGRSDRPNQINNVLAFPGLFKGALAAGATTITKNMQIAAAIAIATIVSDNERHATYIIPSAFDKRVVEAVSQAVKEAAQQDKVTRV